VAIMSRRDEWREELATLTAAGIQPRYPWAQWLDGEPKHLVQGLDYNGPTVRLQHAAKYAARRYGVRVRTRATETGCMLVSFRLQGGEEATQLS
jgi:hypothetical protein